MSDSLDSKPTSDRLLGAGKENQIRPASERGFCTSWAQESDSARLMPSELSLLYKVSDQRSEPGEPSSVTLP